MTKTILILGAGRGGIMAANELSRLAGNDGDINPIRIILFEKEEKNVLSPLLLWLMVGKRKTEQVYGETRKLEGDGVEVVLGNIEKLNPRDITVTVNGKEYKGDYMIVSLGVEQDQGSYLDQFGFNFYTMEGASGFYEQLKNFKGGKIALVIPSLPIKGFLAPYQAAILVENYIREKGLEKVTEITLYTPENAPLSIAGNELSESVVPTMKEKGIKVLTGYELQSADHNKLTFVNGQRADYDLLAYTPIHQCPEVIRQSELAGPSGWLEVNYATLETPFPNVFAVGDITYIPIEKGRTLPKMGFFADEQAKVVAYNIVQKIFNPKQLQKQKLFDGYGECPMEMGDDKVGMLSGNFYDSPSPLVRLSKPVHYKHLTKLLAEKFWWFRHF